jgi:hypothetical protein
MEVATSALNGNMFSADLFANPIPSVNVQGTYGGSGGSDGSSSSSLSGGCDGSSSGGSSSGSGSSKS